MSDFFVKTTANIFNCFLLEKAFCFVFDDQVLAEASEVSGLLVRCAHLFC